MALRQLVLENENAKFSNFLNFCSNRMLKNNLKVKFKKMVEHE